MNTENLVARRRKSLGPTYSHFYENPLYLVRGEGVWLYDNDGTKYLDCYNNVPSVGHCHPHVVEQISKQIATLNTHTRYLHHTVVEYAEMLADTLPGDLSVCMFVCTGTEANDLTKVRYAPWVLITVIRHSFPSYHPSSSGSVPGPTSS
jgi:4-aminobutyrate aminotransferase-like enzyme